jgi:Mrp family chromosome partitioning ATPase
LTTNQRKVLRILGNRKRAVIAGGAGTGKTLIAVEKASASSRQTAAVGLLLLATTGRSQMRWLQDVADEPRITVLSFHQLCDRRIAEASKQLV